jgi:hypothetical protein
MFLAVLGLILAIPVILFLLIASIPGSPAAASNGLLIINKLLFALLIITVLALIFIFPYILLIGGAIAVFLFLRR